MKLYYYDGYDLDKNYATLWNGVLEYNSSTIETIQDNKEKNTNKELDDLVTDICDVNFYINIFHSKIYFSLCQDTKYFYYKFEKDIKRVISGIEDKFKVKIDNGEFNAIELKHNGNQYKYIISKNKTFNISLKKKILNWDNYELKNKKIKRIKDDINKNDINKNDINKNDINKNDINKDIEQLKII
jgi:hypothetical protein